MKKLLLSLILISLFNFAQAQNSGLRFNGLDENLVIQAKPELQAQDNFTIEAWIYAARWKSQFWAGSIVARDGSATDGYAFRAGNNGQLSFVTAVDGAWDDIISGNVMNQDQWHHVAVTIGGGTKTLYIDGSPAATKAFSGTLTPSANNVMIGESSGFPGRYWNGFLDEVRIWNVTRTQQELIDNATTELTGNEPGLVLYLPMNEGSGNTTTSLAAPNCVANFMNMDDSNWSDGFTIPEFDVTMNDIEGIDVINMKNRPVKLKGSVKNIGQKDLTNIDLMVSVNGNPQFTERITATVAPSENYEYNFQTPLDLIGVNDPTITITAIQADDQNNLNNSKSLTINSADANFVSLFDAKQHNFGGAGQLNTNNVLLPADLSGYEQILMHIDVACPSGGCDPWDQPASVRATTDEGTFEIARYITPFGIACGAWTVDVTDFKEILSGQVNFESFVQVWGPSGWLVTIDLEFVEGNNSFPYYKTTPLWTTNYLVYGDPDVSHDLEEQSLTVDTKSEASHIRTTISGHGQGNTGNAAEFLSRTHQFQLNGTTIDNHLLWKADCAANTCSNQAGTWLFPRAGWCPGQAVDPYIVSTTVNGGDNITLDYELEDYTNFLNTGYNSGSHTEPHYRIWSYFVERSSQRFEDYNNLVSDAITPTISGMGMDQTLDAIEIQITNNGSVDLSDFEVSYMINNQLISTETISATLAAGETMVHTFGLIDGLNPGFQNTFFGVVSHPNDENIGDDISKNFIDGLVSTSQVEEAAANIEIFPNPAQGGVFQINVDPIFEGSQVDLVSTDGKIIKTETIRSTNLEMTVLQNGIYFLRFTHPEGFISNKKLVVTE